MRIRCTGQASTVFWCLRFHVALGMNAGGVFNNQQTGLCFLSSVFLAGKYTTRSMLWHDSIHITTVHTTDLNVLCSIRILIIMNAMVASLLPMFIHRGLNMVRHMCLFYIWVSISSTVTTEFSSNGGVLEHGLFIPLVLVISIYLIGSHYFE